MNTLYINLYLRFWHSCMVSDLLNVVVWLGPPVEHLVHLDHDTRLTKVVAKQSTSLKDQFVDA